MNRLDAAILIIRAFALYAFFKALEFFEGYSAMLFAYSAMERLEWSLIATAILVPLSWLVIGGLLFVLSRQVATRFLLAPAQPGDDAPSLDAPSLAATGFAIVGVATMLHALPELLNISYSALSVSNPDERAYRLGPVETKILSAGGQAVLGFLLFLRSRAFAVLWWRKQAPVAKL